MVQYTAQQRRAGAVKDEDGDFVPSAAQAGPRKAVRRGSSESPAEVLASVAAPQSGSPALALDPGWGPLRGESGGGAGAGAGGGCGAITEEGLAGVQEAGIHMSRAQPLIDALMSQWGIDVGGTAGGLSPGQATQPAPDEARKCAFSSTLFPYLVRGCPHVIHQGIGDASYLRSMRPSLRVGFSSSGHVCGIPPSHCGSTLETA